MFTLDIAALEAQEMGGGLSVTFPFSSATGTADTAAVYMVFEPGGALPEHTDSAEEWLLVLEGTVEATVGDETGILEPGQLALVPAIAPHSARNIGDGPARILGFFGASTNVAHFSDELAPGVKTLVVGAQPGVALPLPAPEPAVA
jgi:quercetin dioxygenase-like cupin family protein